MLKVYLATALICALCAACDKKEDSSAAQASEQHASEADQAKDAPGTGEPATELDQAPGTFNGASFSFDIPAGYKAMPSSKAAEFGKQLGQNVAAVLVGERQKDDDFVASIVIVEVAGTGDEARKVDNCKAASEVMASAQGAVVKVPAKAVELPFGKTCQFEVGDAKQHAIQTIAFVGDKHWVVTCNMDAAAIDARRSECEKVLTSFRKSD